MDEGIKVKPSGDKWGQKEEPKKDKRSTDKKKSKKKKRRHSSSDSSSLSSDSDKESKSKKQESAPPKEEFNLLDLGSDIVPVKQQSQPVASSSSFDFFSSMAPQ